MKRSPELTPLSPEHQHALDPALRLRKVATGADGTPLRGAGPSPDPFDGRG